MIKKTLSVLILVFLVGLVAVNAEKVDIGQNIIDYILDNYNTVEITRTSILFYYNPNVCLDCEESLNVINGLKSKGYSIFITDKYFTQLSAGSLAICLNDYSTRRNIKPGELKDYADYCKNFKAPPEGILSTLPKIEEKRYMKYVKLPEDSFKEIIYITILKNEQSGFHQGFHAYLDRYNSKVQAMSPEEQTKLVEKAEKFVIDRVWTNFRKSYEDPLYDEDKKLYEEKVSLANLSTPEVTARLAEINERRTEIEESLQKLRSVYKKAYDAGDIELLKDYSLPWEGEIIDGFTLKKGWAPQPEYNFPKKVSEFFGRQDLDEGFIFSDLDSVYIFVEEELPQVEQKSVSAEEKPTVEEPVAKEEPAAEEKSAIEEQPVTGINRIINPIKKLFTGEPKTEETPSEQPAEQPKEEKKENFVKRFFKKIFSWF